MRLTTAIASVSLVLFAFTVHGAQTALVGGTVINPADGKIIPDAVVLIEGDHIVAAGTRANVPIPTGAKPIDCAGKFVLPGYIDTHVHFFQSGDLFTRPDVVDLTKVRPYQGRSRLGQGVMSRTYFRAICAAALLRL